jgi:hypothetical protein
MVVSVVSLTPGCTLRPRISLTDVRRIEKACDDLLNSCLLPELLGIVLNIGNRLNTAGRGNKPEVHAFSIKSLLRLHQMKTFDKKTTLLHYIVRVAKENNVAVLNFTDDLRSVSEADNINLNERISELDRIGNQLDKLRKLSNIMADEGRLLSTNEFALSATEKVSQLRELVDTVEKKFSRLLKYLCETKMQPHELFEIINTFCRTFDVARADVEKMEKVKVRVIP